MLIIVREVERIDCEPTTTVTFRWLATGRLFALVWAKPTYSNHEALTSHSNKPIWGWSVGARIVGNAMGLGHYPPFVGDAPCRPCLWLSVNRISSTWHSGTWLRMEVVPLFLMQQTMLISLPCACIIIQRQTTLQMGMNSRWPSKATYIFDFHYGFRFGLISRNAVSCDRLKTTQEEET